MINILTVESEENQQVTSASYMFVTSRITTVLAFLLVVVQTVLIVKDSSWTLVSDDFEFLTHFVSAKPFLPTENFFSGRFTPLAFQEYNLFVLIGNCPYAYYSWVCIKYLISLMFFFLIQKEVFNLTGLARLSKDCKLLVFSASTIVFLLLPGFFVVFLDVVYYENTSVPISLILIYTLISIFKQPSLLKIILVLMLFNTLIYLKETYVVFFVPFLFMVLFNLRNRTQSVAYRLAILALSSIVVYFIAYVLIVGLRTEVFYFERTSVDLLTGMQWMIFLNPTYISVLTCLTLLVALRKNSFVGTPFVTFSALTVCTFFLVTGMYAMGYQMSIVYPFLFFTTQIELSSVIQRYPKSLKVLIPLLIVLIMFSGIILTGTTRPYIISRGHHWNVLEFIEEWGREKNAQTYIYKEEKSDFRKTQLGVALDLIANGNASMESVANILEIESASEIQHDESAVVFIPKEDLFSNEESLSSEISRKCSSDTLVRIQGFDYDVVLLN